MAVTSIREVFLSEFPEGNYGGQRHVKIEICILIKFFGFHLFFKNFFKKIFKKKFSLFLEKSLHTVRSGKLSNVGPDHYYFCSKFLFFLNFVKFTFLDSLSIF